MDTLLKSALEGLDNEEVIPTKRKTLDNGNGKDVKKIKPNAPVKDKDVKEDEPGGKDNEGRDGDEPKDDKSWNWTPRTSNGYQQGGGYQRPYQQYQQRPPYGGGGGGGFQSQRRYY